MKMHRSILTLALVAFLASNFPLGPLGVYSRFPTIAALVVSSVVLISRTRLTGISAVFVTLYLFLTYSFITTFWTESVPLSLIKWLLYGVTCIAFLAAGTAVAQNSPADSNPFDPLKWLLVPMMISSLIALVTGMGWADDNFRGMCGNSNALGASIVLTSPWVIYELKKSWNMRWRRRWLLMLAASIIVVMFATHSRAALCAFLILPAFATRQLKLGRKIALAYFFLIVLVATYIFKPESFDVLYHSYVAKRSDSILASRGNQMEDSWDAAKQGGVFGEGFGVSVGVSRYWDWTTFSRVSREKGNSVLAIVEETGVVGLSFYIALLVAVYLAFRRLSRTMDPDQKLIANIAMGYFLAALIHGQFEAWFLSFGPDVSVYWGTIGMALGGMTRKATYERNTRMETAPRAGVLAPATGARG
jgi:O-antigen ligase